MKKIFSKSNIIFTFIYLSSILITFNSSVQWVAMSTFWFGLVLYINQFKYNYLSSLERKVFYIIAAVYPILETIIKILIDRNVIQGSWFWLNTLEHFLWAFFFNFMIYFVFKIYFKNTNIIVLLLTLIAITSLVGNLNEFLEYVIREFANLKSIVYYPDTIRDMFMNLLGGIVSSLYIILRFRKGV